MVNESLRFITETLNSYLKTHLSLNEDKAVLSNLINIDGTIPINIADKLVVCLLNIDQEVGTSNVGFSKTVAASATSNLSLEVLFAANFSNYSEQLKFISIVLSYFQQNTVFGRQNYPTITEGINKIELELTNLNPEDTNFVWNTLGAKYMPSLIYKIKVETQPSILHSSI